MKHRIWIVSLLCAVLLLGSCPAMAEGAEETIELGQTLCQSGQVTLTLDSLTFGPDSGLSLSCTVANAQTEGTVSVLLSECLADGLYLPLDMGAALTVEPGESLAFSASVTEGAAKALSKMGVESVARLSVRYRVLDGDGKTIASGLSPELTVPGMEAPAVYTPDDAPMYYQDGLRVYSLGFDGTAGQAALLLEKTVGSWSGLRLDAVFDGVQEGRSLELPMENGERRVCVFSAEGPVSGVDIYCSPIYLSSLSVPIRLTLGSPGTLGESASSDEPLWAAGDCELRFLGVSDSYFCDSDALLFECVNRSGETYWLYPAGDSVNLDGVPMAVSTTGAQCYPGSRRIAAVAVDDLAAPDLSEYEKLELALELYTLGGAHLKSEYESEPLSIELKD